MWSPGASTPVHVHVKRGSPSTARRRDIAGLRAGPTLAQSGRPMTNTLKALVVAVLLSMSGTAAVAEGPGGSVPYGKVASDGPGLGGGYDKVASDGPGNGGGYVRA